MVGAPVGMLFVAIFLAGRADAAVVGPGYDIEMSRLIPVRDGTLLEAWITKPSNLTMKVPTILTLTQYDIDGGRHGDEAGYYTRRGYAFVQAYVRGRGRSGGDKSDNLGASVGRDGYDLVEWIAPLNSPNYQKNFNTGGRIGYEKLQDAQIAHIKIFHDAKRASRLTLPLAAPVARIGAE